VGKGDPLVDGYSPYGSLGQYFLFADTNQLPVAAPAATQPSTDSSTSTAAIAAGVVLALLAFFCMYRCTRADSKHEPDVRQKLLSEPLWVWTGHRWAVIRRPSWLPFD
jgi:hypothetical protein